MKKTDFPLFYFGLFTALFLGALTRQVALGFGVGSFYLLVVFLPYLPWVYDLDETLLAKYFIINILGFFFNPMVYYMLNLLSMPINLKMIIFVAILIFASGSFFRRYRPKSLK